MAMDRSGGGAPTSGRPLTSKPEAQMPLHATMWSTYSSPTRHPHTTPATHQQPSHGSPTTAPSSGRAGLAASPEGAMLSAMVWSLSAACSTGPYLAGGSSDVLTDMTRSSLCSRHQERASDQEEARAMTWRCGRHGDARGVGGDSHGGGHRRADHSHLGKRRVSRLGSTGVAVQHLISTSSTPRQT